MDRKMFYRTPEWKRCRTAYLKKKRYICERCGDVAKIVHHKTYLTDENIYDKDITLNEDNLEALCLECHNKEHNVKAKLFEGYGRYKKNLFAKKNRRFIWSEDGRCTPL